MSKKVHCARGHIMKRDGDMWRCYAKIKKGDKKVQCNDTKAWSYVTKL